MKKSAKEMKEQYQWEAKSQWKGRVIEGDLEIEVRLFFGDKRRRDWDNWHKISMDALNDIVWLDDSQVKKATVTLHYDKANPRTEILVKDLTD
jgi:Holliday junction resolvase RusA-like endonuclease